MSLIVSESALSRPFTVGRQCGRELIYDVIGSDPHSAVEEDDVKTAVLAEAPAVYWGRILEEVKAEVVGPGVWKAHCRYVTWESEYSFDTTGGTQKVMQSIATVASYAPPGMTAPDFQGAIGVSDDRVEGADVPSRQFNFSETHRFTDSMITPSYKRTLFLLTGTRNQAAFREYDAGEALFLGATGTKRGDDVWALTFKFAASPNVSGLSIGGISGISKLGWDYLWVRYAEFADSFSFTVVKRPVAVYVERVIQPGDFSLLGIPT